MLDYYFCQECQTYHQPNRVINGQILSACQCSISTQPSYDQINRNSRRNIQYSPSKQRTIHIPPTQHQEGVRISPLRIDSSVSNFRGMPSPVRRYENMPFISIIDEENRERMKKIIMSPQSRQTNVPVFMSPRKTREQVTIRKSVSPLARSQRKIITTSPIKRTVTRYPIIQKVVPVQQLKPNLVVIRTPIQTVNNLAYPQKVQTRINTLLKDPYQEDQFQPPSIKVIKQPSKRAIQMPHQNLNRLTLDRVSGERYGEEFSEQNQYKQQRFVLDRVKAEDNVTFQTNEKENCCAQMCYH